MVSRGDVYWVELDPTVGSEIKKTRPCLIVSPDDMNQVLPSLIIAPITSKGQALGCRPEVKINGKRGRVLLDQIRTVDKKRLQGKLAHLPLPQWHNILIQMLS